MSRSRGSTPEDEDAYDLAILKDAERAVSEGYQPSRATWDAAAKSVVAGTLNSLSDVALAVYGSRENTPTSSTDSFVDDGRGPNHHIPSFLQLPLTTKSVRAVIQDALPGHNIDVPACHRAASHPYGLWCCPSPDCSYFLDLLHLRPGEASFALQWDAIKAGVIKRSSGEARIKPGDPTMARILLQLLSNRHLDVAHLGRRGLEMVVSCSEFMTEAQLVTWRWKADWLELMPDIQDAADDDERGLTFALRRWLSEKGARACDRLRRGLWIRYRLWARTDRAWRQDIVRSALEAGEDDHTVALKLAFECRMADFSAEGRAALDAQATAQALDRDVENFTQLTVRPWPREYFTWEGLSDKERADLTAAYASGDHNALLKCERRVYHYPWLSSW
ncbi:unnamed protein product [Peniophora sp. CBMAI 1063]|nr:unnamed protein product [Peniophora sp. CBMAI 1063]